MNKNYDKAILVVSFGTSYEETRKKTIDAIEEDIREAFPDYKIYRAFTSKIIIKKLKSRDNIHVDTVSEALERMINDGIKDLILQPTHVINGIENDFMLEDLAKLKDKFNSIKIGAPLLTFTDDYKNIINILTKEFSYIKEDEALIIMGHGTNHHANATYAALDYTFKEMGYRNIYIGNVESYPELDNVINLIEHNSYKKLYLTPLMIVAGDHAINDMASDEEDSWKSILENKGYNVECIIKGLGEYKEIRDMFINHIQMTF